MAPALLIPCANENCCRLLDIVYLYVAGVTFSKQQTLAAAEQD